MKNEKQIRFAEAYKKGAMAFFLSITACFLSSALGVAFIDYITANTDWFVFSWNAYEKLYDLSRRDVLIMQYALDLTLPIILGLSIFTCEYYKGE